MVTAPPLKRDADGRELQVAAFEVANLAYTHPILHILAEDFNVSDERASLVPTMLQTGYTAGLLLICPAGDLLPRRPLIIFLIFATAMVVSPSLL